MLYDVLISNRVSYTMISLRKASGKLSPVPKRSLPSSLQQRREILLPLIPIAVLSGAAAFAYITWSQVREKRRKRETEALAATETPAKAAEKGKNRND